jgi:mannose-6-phosphate isomerase
VALYPLKFKPRLLEKMWAGRKIETVLGKPLPPGKNIGESWELYDFPPGMVDKSSGWISAEVANGPLAGKTLHELVVEYGRELLGDVSPVAPHNQFPILIKFLDAREDLSIQVHPDCKYAAKHADAFLKSEAWYIVQADPGARLFKGLKPGATAEQFKDAILNGHCEQLLNAITVKPGDFFYLPSGTVHAVGAGMLAAEVQTPSDTTFRVYDFNRVDPSTSKTRQLHVEQALECIHFDEQAPTPKAVDHLGSLHVAEKQLVKCEFFNIEEVRLNESIGEPLEYERPVVWMMLEGEAQVHVDDLSEPVRIKRGETVLLPAVMRNPVLTTEGKCLWLEVTFPGQSSRSKASPT